MITNGTKTSLLATLALLALTTSAFAQSINVDGQYQQFNPGPVERSGRIFVPLRGIFERLGANVVYSNGTINATGRDGRTVSLQIGSTQATVGGQPSTLDVAPFLIGESTYVPLRFVSQALGANVAYDSGNNTVNLNTAGSNGGNAQPQQMQPPRRPQGQGWQDRRNQRGGVQLTNVQPGQDANVQSRRPTIAAGFSERIDADSLRITLDGSDVTDRSTRSQSGFVYSPSSSLQAGNHRVAVRGNDSSGRGFDRSWQFDSGNNDQAEHNFVSLTSPRDGAVVSGDFMIRGRTLPNSSVRITAGAVADQIPGFSFGTGSYTGDVIADGNGNFSANISLNSVRGGSIGVTAISTAPGSRESAQDEVRLRSS